MHKHKMRCVHRVEDRMERRSHRSHLLSAAVAITLGVVLQPADVRAQAGGDTRMGALEEVVVTARKREESVQSIPSTVAVFAGQDLIDRGVLRAAELQFAVPGFVVQNFESRATITMRGVGAQIAGGTSSVAAHLNGIYQASAAAQLNRLFDVERVEVVKGPQGTLYGRNSTGGALNILTRKPGNELSGDITVGFGAFETQRFDGGLSVPLGDNWSARVAVSYLDDDGRYDNLATGGTIGETDFLGGRFSLAGSLGGVDMDLFLQASEASPNADVTLIPVSPENAVPVFGWDKTWHDFPTEPFFERDTVIAGADSIGRYQ